MKNWIQPHTKILFILAPPIAVYLSFSKFSGTI